MRRFIFNLKYVFLILSLLLIFSGTVFAQGIRGDINDDDSIDLADVILALQVVSGLDPGGITVDADVDGDGKMGMAEAIYALQWAAGVYPLTEDWEAILYDGDGLAGGWINFTLTKNADDTVTADGNFSYEIDTVIIIYPINEVVSGDFHDQPMTIDGNQMSTVYVGQALLQLGTLEQTITYTVSLFGITDNGTVTDGTWSVTTIPSVLTLGGNWDGTRTSGYGITE